MLEFAQVGDEVPKDVQVTTDDAQAEMAAITELFDDNDLTELEAYKNLSDAERGEDGKFVFIVPGVEAGEIGDYWNTLADQLDTWNEEALAAAEAAADGE